MRIEKEEIRGIMKIIPDEDYETLCAYATHLVLHTHHNSEYYCVIYPCDAVLPILCDVEEFKHALLKDCLPTFIAFLDKNANIFYDNMRGFSNINPIPKGFKNVWKGCVINNAI